MSTYTPTGRKYTGEQRNQHRKHVAKRYLKENHLKKFAASYQQTSLHKGKSILTGLASVGILSQSIVIILLISMHTVAAEVEVAWHLMSPVSFSKTAYLSCNISQNSSCQTGLRQWLGGSKYGPLCQNNICVNGSKYDTMKNVSHHICSYTLMIHKFSEDDVNCEYTCSYGVKYKRKFLAVNDKDFQYIPTKNDISTNISKEVLYIQIRKVFPAPKCSTIFLEQNTSIPMRLNLSNHGIFFEVVMAGKLVSTSCSGTLDIVCDIGMTRQSIKTETFNFCSSESDSLGKWWTIILGVVVASVISVALLVWVWYRYAGARLTQYCKGNDKTVSLTTTAAMLEDTKSDSPLLPRGACNSREYNDTKT